MWEAVSYPTVGPAAGVLHEYDQDAFRGPEPVFWMVRALLAVPLVIPIPMSIVLGPWANGALAFVWDPIGMVLTLPRALRGERWSEYLWAAPIPQLVPFLGGLVIALWVAALVASFRGEATETALAMIGFGAAAAVAGVFSAGSPMQFLNDRSGWLALPLSALYATGGLFLIVTGDRSRSRRGGIDAATARAIWAAERREAALVSGSRLIGVHPHGEGQSDLLLPMSRQPTGLLGTASAVPVEYATWGRRLGARVIDFFVTLVLFVPVLAGVTAAIAAATNTDFVFAFFVAIYIDMGLWEGAYYLVGASHGQTIGKQMLGIRVCRESGERLGFWLAVGRNFTAILSSLAFGIGWLAPLWTPKRQTWHDSMTGTIVIRDESAKLASRAVAWGMAWTVLSGLGIGLGGAFLWDAIDGDSYDWEYYGDSHYEDDSYGYHQDGWCDHDDYYEDPDC